MVIIGLRWSTIARNALYAPHGCKCSPAPSTNTSIITQAGRARL